MDDVERLTAAWDRIEAWLREHAPASAALLRPPAGDADIAAAEAAMGVELPATLAAWYRVHDGLDEDRVPFDAPRIAGILPSDKTMLPLERLVNEYRAHQEWDDREAEGLLPFARTPGDTWYGWYVDARKGEPSYGNLGIWGVDQGDDPYPAPDGWPLPDWLTEIAAALEQGRPLTRPDGTEERWTRPALDQDGLTWEDGRDSRLVRDAVILYGPR